MADGARHHEEGHFEIFEYREYGMMEYRSFLLAQVMHLAKGWKRAGCVGHIVQYAVPVDEEAADLCGGCGLGGIVCNCVAPGFEFGDRAWVVQDKFVEAES